MRVFTAFQRAMISLGPAGPLRDDVQGDEDEVAGETRSVLIVDDELAALRKAERILRAQGYLPIATNTPHSALQIARSMRPRLILLDVLMPGFDGWDVLAALKADPATRDIPVLMISMMAERRRALESGADGVMPRPLDSARIQAALAALSVGCQDKSKMSIKRTHHVLDTQN